MIRQGHLTAIVGTLLMGCAVVLLVVGCAGVRSGAPEEEQGHTEATEQGQARSPEATSQEARCRGTRTIIRQGTGYRTNDVPGCPKGGQLSGIDKLATDEGSGIRGLVIDQLAGMDGDDEIHGLGGSDEIFGGAGSDVIYGGAGGDFIYGTGLNTMSDYGRVTDRDVFYGGDGADTMYAGKSADVLHGGDGNDYIVAAPADVDFGPNKQQDMLYCGEGRDTYYAGSLDYVDSSCEEGYLVDTGGPPLIFLAGAALLSIGLLLVRYVIRRAS